MNIDKIYKPLKPKYLHRVEEVELAIYNPIDVKELEEKYKELLEDRIAILKGINLKLGVTRFMFLYEDDINMIERYTGLKWEDIINEN